MRLLLTVTAILSSPVVNPVRSQGIMDIIQMIPSGFFDVLQSFSWGRCPRVATVPDFDPAMYLGEWYSQRQTPSFFQPRDQG